MSRYGMVIDLSLCTGCQTCVIACQMNNNQRPGIAWSKVDFIEKGRYPEGDRFALPHACMHCENAPCVQACPTSASVQRADGIVTVDYNACMACGACLMVCPYGARSISFKEEWNLGAEAGAPYEVYGTPHVDVAEKCIFCADRVDADLEPHCVNACPQAARIFGDLDDPASPASLYIQEHEAEALRGTALHYVKGDHEFSLREELLTNVSEVPNIMLSETGSSSPAGEPQDPNVGAIAAAAVGVAAVGAAAGFAAGSSHGKKKAAAMAEKDGE